MDWLTLIASENAARLPALEEDYAHLSRQLARRGVDIEELTARAMAFRVAVPSWGVGTGGTRFARFPMAGEPRSVFEKHRGLRGHLPARARHARRLAAHPWDRPERPGRAARAISRRAGCTSTP